jgi:hypothetical protein
MLASLEIDMNENIAALSWLRTQPPTTRALLGLLIIAWLALYVPVLIVAIFGARTFNVGDFTVNAVLALILMAQNGLGMLVRRIALSGVIFAVIWLVFWAGAILATERLEHWWAWWVVLFVPPVASILNALAFNSYWQAVTLDERALKRR